MLPQAAKRLLAAGADPDATNSRGETPLQWAAWSGSRDMVEMLLASGASLHARDHFPSAGWTALLCAAHQVKHLAPSGGPTPEQVRLVSPFTWSQLGGCWCICKQLIVKYLRWSLHGYGLRVNKGGPPVGR